MYGGMCCGMYTKSTADLATIATQYGMDVRFFYLFNESLITRARNYLVDEFLRSPYTHLMFIDSDIHFNPNDVLTLAALDKEIIGAPYPKKVIAWEKVRNAVDAGLAGVAAQMFEVLANEGVNIRVITTSEIKVSVPVEVLEIGTGWGCCFARDMQLKDYGCKVPTTTIINRVKTNFDGSRYIHAFFDTVIDSEAFAGAGSGGSDRYLSEDYMFCQFTRKIGISTWLCPWMKLGHVGSYVFNGTLPALGNLDFAAHGNDMESRPHNITVEEENEAETAAGKTLNRSEKRKAARKNRKAKK